MVDLGTLSELGASSVASSVNASGQIVGFFDERRRRSSLHAFSWTPAGGMVDLGTLGGGG